MEPKRIALWVGAVVAAIYCIYTLGAIGGQRSKTPSPFGPVSASATPSALLTVQVAGSVVHPGVYALPANSRVQDAVQKAGGPTSDADESALNLAGWLQDGAKIEVPSRAAPGALAPLVPVQSVPLPTTAPPVAVPPFQPIASPSLAPSVPVASAPTGAVPSTTPVGSGAPNTAPDAAAKAYLRTNPVDLNTATETQLDLLPEIGPKMAQRILDYRATNGPFHSTQDLMLVKGIGAKKFASVEPYICVR